MRIINEIGWKRIIKYLIFSLWQWIFDFLPLSPLRICWLRFGGAKIGRNCVVDKIDFINLDRSGLGSLTIGNECFLGRGALFDLAGEIMIKDQTTISPRAVILTHFSVGFSDHPLIKKFPKFVKRTVLDKGCFIGVGSVILAGVTVGSKSLVAASSVVKENVEDKSMVAGAPAKVKRKYEN